MHCQCQVSVLQAMRAACVHFGPAFVYFWAPQKLLLLLHILSGTDNTFAALITQIQPLAELLKTCIILH